MGYQVIHLIEAAYWIKDLDYSQLVEQCEQIYSGLAEDENCSGQICLTMSDVVREISSEDGWWPGEEAFHRPRYTYVPEAKISFEDALNTAALHMQDGGNWAVILYTAGGIRRPKRTMLYKWKKKLWVPLMLLAVKNINADPKFLESYTEEKNIFPVGMHYDVIERLKSYGIRWKKQEGILSGDFALCAALREINAMWEEEEENGVPLEKREQVWEEDIWELVRVYCGTLL